LANGTLLGMPYAAIILVVAFAVVYILLRYHVYGRKVIAIGSNEEAVRLSGINVKQIKMSVYVFSAFLTTIAALLMVGRTGVGTPNVGVGMELDAISAVVIGGASLSGGKGTVFHTLLGVFILGMIGNIMNLMDVTSYLQQLIKGVIIILAVIFQKR